MTIQLTDLEQVYLVCGKNDMWQEIDSLAFLVKSQFDLDPFTGQVWFLVNGSGWARRSSENKMFSLFAVQSEVNAF